MRRRSNKMNIPEPRYRRLQSLSAMKTVNQSTLFSTKSMLVRFLAINLVAAVIAFCLESVMSLSAAEVQKESSVGVLLQQKLEHFGCKLSFKGTKVEGLQRRTQIEQDDDGARIYVAGDCTEAVLDAFKKSFGEPAYHKKPAGLNFFQYRKDQCGVVFLCHAEDSGQAMGLKAPFTVISIAAKIIPPAKIK